MIAMLLAGWLGLIALPASACAQAPQANSLKNTLQLADSLLEEEAYELALNNFRRAEEQLEGASDSLRYLVVGNIDLCLGNIAMIESRYDTALTIVDRAHGAFLKAGNYDKAVYSLMDEALIHWYSGQQQLMKSSLEKAEEVAKRHLPPNHVHLGSVYHLQGFVYKEIGDYHRGTEFSLKALNVYQRQEPVDTGSVMTIYNNLGAFYRRMGNYDKALEYYLAALHLILKSGTTDTRLLPTLYRNLTVLYRYKENYREALHYNQRALELLYKEPPGPSNYDEYIRTFNNRAATFNEMHVYDSALVYLDRTMDLHRYSDYNKELTLDLYGGVYQKMGQPERAERYLRATISLNLEKSGRNQWLLPQSYRQLGAVLLEQGRLREALSPLQQALISLVGPFQDEDYLVNPRLEDFVAPTSLLLVLRDKGRVLREMGQLEQDPTLLRTAFSTMELATQLIDSLRNDYLESTHHFWNEQAGPVYEGAIAVSEQLYRQTGDASYLKAAFRFAEKSKAHALAVALQDAAARKVSNIPSETLERERSIRLEKAYYKEQIFRERQKGSEADTDKILLWQGKVLETSRVGEALMAELERDYPVYHQVKYNFEVADLTAVREALPTQSVLVEYFVGEEQLFVFTITTEEAFLFSQPRDSVTMGQLQAFLVQLQDRRRVLEAGNSRGLFESFTHLGSALFDALLRPALSRAAISRLIVIPDGDLSYLPFELLLEEPVPSGTAVDYAGLPYLLKRCPLRYEYSATLLTRPMNNEGTRKGITGFAPSYASNWMAAARDAQVHCADAREMVFGNLSNNLQEVRAIVDRWEGRAFFAEEATEGAFRRYATGSRVLHLAMHGFINHCDPHYSGLVFTLPSGNELPSGRRGPSSAAPGAADDGILHAYEIYSMRLDAELAVLSACHTGAGQFAKGEGVMSLARAFRYAGCANVLTSLWQADDGATAAIMEDFYGFLGQGKGKDEALQMAKLKYIQGSNRNHPFFWGAFILLGDDLPVELPERSKHWIWLLAALIIVATGWAYNRWRRMAVNEGAEVPVNFSQGQS